MNLTVEQMDVLNFRLTEISLQLLGNQFFDIFGRECDTLGSLYRSKSGPTTHKFAATSDLVAALNVEDFFNLDDERPEEAHVGNRRNDNCKNENVSDASSDDESVRTDGPEYSDHGESDPLSERKIAQILNDVDQEYSRLLIGSDSAKMKYFITHKHRMETEYEDEYEICSQFHRQEYEALMGQSDAFIKLIKYIKCDSRNALQMGEIAATILKVKDRFGERPPSTVTRGRNEQNEQF